MAIKFLKEPAEVSEIEKGGISFRFEGTELMSKEQRFEGTLKLGDNFNPTLGELDVFFKRNILQSELQGISFVGKDGKKYVIPSASVPVPSWSFIEQHAKYQLADWFSFELIGHNRAKLAIDANTANENLQIVDIEPNHLRPRFEIIRDAHTSKPRQSYFFLVEVFFRGLGEALFRSVGRKSITKTRREIDLKTKIDSITELEITDFLSKAINEIEPTFINQSQITGEFYVEVSENFMYYPHEVTDGSHGYFTARSIIRRVTKQLQRSTMGATEAESLVLALQPPNVVFSQDPIPFQLKSRIFLDTPTVHSVTEFKIPPATLNLVKNKQRPTFQNLQNKIVPLWPDDQPLEFKFADQSIKLWPVKDPDGSGLQFPEVTASAVDIEPYLQANYVLTKHFDIEYQAPKAAIIFKAKKPGPAFNLSGNDFLKPISLGVDQADRPNFRFLFEVFFRRTDQTSFECIFSAQIAQDAPFSGLASIDVGDILDPFLEHDVLNIVHQHPLFCQKSTGVFFVQFAEVYGQPAQVHKLLKSEPKTVFKGSCRGRSKSQDIFHMLTARRQDQIKDCFLKMGKSVQTVHREQPLKLFFVNTRSENKQLRLVTLIERSNGSLLLRYSRSCDTTPFSKICFDASIRTEDAVVQRCWVENQDEQRVSEKFIFQVNQEYLAECRFFAYVSSLGALETFSTRGEGGHFFDILNETAESETIARTRTQIQYNSRVKRTFKVTTGWQSREEFDQFADFFRSDHKFIIEEDQLTPIIITTKKAGERREWKHLYQSVFEYQYAEEEKNF